MTSRFFLSLIALAILPFSIANAQSFSTGYLPSDETGMPKHDRVFVFVHGLSSGGGDNSVTTWTNLDDGTYWPQKLRDDPEFDGFDIYVANYETSAWETDTFESVADSLRTQLLVDVAGNHSEIFFVAHSLGGIALRRAILDSDELQEKTESLFLFAVPNGGAGLAKFADWVPHTGPLIDLLERSDGDNDSPLTRVKSEWINKDLDIPSFCGFETVDLNLAVGVLVPRESVEPLCTDGISALARNHNTIVQPGAEPTPREIADPHILLKIWLDRVTSKNGFVGGIERFDERDLVIASCRGDRDYSLDTIANIREIVRTSVGNEIVGVSRPMPTRWLYSDYSNYLWSEEPPDWVVIHYSCFERADREASVSSRDENFINFAKDMLRSGVNVLTYSRTFLLVDDRRRYICGKFSRSKLLDEQDEAHLFMFPVIAGNVIGSGNDSIDEAFGQAVFDTVVSQSEDFRADTLCEEVFEN